MKLTYLLQKKAEKQSQFDSSISQVPVITSEASAVAVVSSSNQIPIANPYNNYAVQQVRLKKIFHLCIIILH